MHRFFNWCLGACCLLTALVVGLMEDPAAKQVIKSYPCGENGHAHYTPKGDLQCYTKRGTKWQK